MVFEMMEDCLCAFGTLYLQSLLMLSVNALEILLVFGKFITFLFRKYVVEKKYIYRNKIILTR